MVTSASDHVGRRRPVTTVAVVVTVPSCASATVQCWVERLVRTGVAVTSNVPSATGAA